MSLTIFEGVDGAGKSWLIERLGPFNRVVAHGPYLGRTGFEIARTYARSIHAARRGAQVALDRSWYSEGIYGPVVRGVDRLDGADLRMLDRLALAYNAVLVLLRSRREEALAVWRSRTEYVRDPRLFDEIFDRYASLTSRHLPTIVIDRATVAPHAFVGYVRERLLEVRGRANAGPGIGYFGPPRGLGRQTLVVGERASSGGAVDTPFVAFHNGGCSRWFAQRLDEAGASERGLYWVNARRPGGAWQDPSFLDHLTPLRVVALGSVAERWLRRIAGLTRFETFDHPQYWKRFRFHDPYPAALRLAELSPFPKEDAT